MGKVLLAHDPVLDREVAINLLRSDLGVAPDQRAALLERMRHEARACARLTHPNLVALHDLGEDGEDYEIATVPVELQSLSIE